MKLHTWHSEELGREFYFRPGLDDEAIYDFECRWHIPPEWAFAPRSILDCGSNIGLTMAHYRHLFPEAPIVGVELDAENVVIARMNVGDPILCAALSKYGNEVVYAYRSDSKTNSYNVFGDRNDGQGDRLAVGVSVLDLEREFPEERIGLLKLDIEGSEKNILSDPESLERVESVLVETHEPYTREEADAHLREAGFLTQSVPHPKAVYAWKAR